MAEFKINHAGLREYLLSSDLYPALEKTAAIIEERAKSIAPVETPESAADHGRTPGKFRDSIHRKRHKSPSRSTVRVVADCEGAAPIEYHSRTLGRAAG